MSTLDLQLKTIRVYGTLAKTLKRRTFKAVIKSPLDAINFLLSNFPELKSFITPRAFQIIVNNKPITEHQLATNVDFIDNEIHIIPAISGAGGNNNALYAILAGTVLIAASFIFPFAAPILLPLGIGLVLTGVAALIAPVTPDDPERDDPAESYNFNGVQNTSREGVAVPCVYGEIITGSVTISAGIREDEEEIEEEFEGGTGNPDPIQEPFPETIITFGPEIEPPFPSSPQPAEEDTYGALAIYYWQWTDVFANGSVTCSQGQCWSYTDRVVSKVVEIWWKLDGSDLGPDIIWEKEGPLYLGWTPNTIDCDALCPSTLGCYTQQIDGFTKSANYFRWLPYRSDGVTAANGGLTSYRYSGGPYTRYNGSQSCTARTRIPQGITSYTGYGVSPSDALLALPDISEVEPPIGVPEAGYDERD